MNYVFSIENGYNEDDLLELNRLYAKKNPNRRAANLIFRILKLAIGAVLLYAGIFGVAKGQVSTLMRVLFIIVGAAELLSGLLHNRVRAFRGKRMMQQQISRVTVTLNDDGITEATNAGENVAAYSDVEDVYFQKDRWFLFLQDGHVLVLPQSCMKGESAASFEEHLSVLTGVEIRHEETRS